MSVAGRENTERAVIIEKNSQALLERVRLIQNAKDEIILSTFADVYKRQALTFYGSSFITDATGEVVEQMDRVSEGFILHSFDLDELESCLLYTSRCV